MTLAAISWRAVELWPAALIAIALTMAAAMLLYPPQVRKMPARWRWLPPVLRAVALVALAVSVLRPVLIRTRSVEEQGAVVVLLDRSASMGIADHSPESAPDRNKCISQLVALAESLGRLGDDARPQDVAAVHRDLTSLESLADDIARLGRELEFARLSGRQTGEAQQRLQAACQELVRIAQNAERAGRKVGLRNISAEEWGRRARSPRPEDRRRLLDAIHGALDQARRIEDAKDSELYRKNAAVRQVCDELAGMSRLDLCWESLASSSGLLTRLGRQVPVVGFGIGEGASPLPLKEEGRPIRKPPVAADAAMSDLTGGIGQAMRQMAGRRVQAVILFSDGRQVGGSGALPAGAVPSGVPVFTVNAASGNVRDLSIDHIEVPEADAVFVGESVRVNVMVRMQGLDGGRLAGDLTVDADGQTLQAQPIRLKDPRAELQRLELKPIRLTRPGPQRLVVNLPLQGGEASRANNQAERWVKVLSQRLRVTAIASAPAWDFRYLRNMLSRSSWVELRDAIVVPGVSSLAMPPEQILQQDLVILYDVPRDALSARQWEAIGRLVRERGGSLILVPGLVPPQPSAREYPLADLLPYSGSVRPAWQNWLGQRPSYHLSPAAGSEELRVLQLEGSWDDLPGFYRYLAIPRLNENVRARLVVREARQMPILTEARIGRGRVFFFGMQETWRWRNTVGERDQDSFWWQLVRHAMDKPYALVSGELSFDADRIAAPGEPVQVRCRLIVPPGRTLPDQIPLSIIHEGELFRLASLEPAGGAAGRYHAAISDLPAGEYELRVAEPGDTGSFNELMLPLTIRRSDKEELANPGGDQKMLESLAEATGGRCVPLEQVSSLPGLLEAAREQQPRTVELALWDSVYLFVFVLCCLSAEWALRKRFGLA